MRSAVYDRVRNAYGSPNARGEPVHIEGKLVQILACLFTSLYPQAWTSFFADFRALAGDPSSLGKTNPLVTTFYLKLIEAVHDEIADLYITRSPEELKRNTTLKDLVRDRDAATIATTWQSILSQWATIDSRITRLCLVGISKYVSWTDISLVAHPDMLRHLWDIAGQQLDPTRPLDQPKAETQRAAIDTFTEIIGKKMPAADKIQLIHFLDANTIIQRLTLVDALSTYRKTSRYDTDLAETVAKLTNAVLFDAVKVLDGGQVSDDQRQQTDAILRACVPHMIRFLSDEYDEVCSTVIPALTDLLAYFRKQAKAPDGLRSDYTDYLQTILDNVVLKMKYDETAEWSEDNDDTEDADFKGLRDRLHVLQTNVAAINDTMYMQTLSKLVVDTFAALDAGGVEATTWQDVDLALHEMFLFGELTQKNSGIHQKSTPTTVAIQYRDEMMTRLIESNIAAYPHPAVQLQYMEICARYCMGTTSYFDSHPQSIPRALQHMVGAIQTNHPKVKARSWYLFYRFVKNLRQHLADVAQEMIQAVAGVLVIRSEVPSPSRNDDSDSDDTADAEATNQLYLFEAVGCICSIPAIPTPNQVFYMRMVLEPLLSNISQQGPASVGGDETALLQLQRTILAIGRFAEGVSGGMNASHQQKPRVAAEVSTEFATVSVAVLSALESLKQSFQIRNAARQTLARLVGVLGPHIMQQLPRWLEGLLSQSSNREELAGFLRQMDQINYGFKAEIFDMLDRLIGPLLQRVFAGLAEPVTGTDDAYSMSQLKATYLGFLIGILSNDLAGVLISPTNQATFEPLLSSLEHFCRDAHDLSTAKLAYGVLTRMTSVWGGPDLTITSDNGAAESETPSPVVPGFDTFVISRFSPLTWQLMRHPSFSAKDGQARLALGEAAALQWTVLRKCGAQYERHLRAEELPGMGMNEGMMDEYIRRLRTGDLREYKKQFLGFVDAAAAASSS